ncbi:hypothetical protein F2Q70_00001682 [Brassica cretica]|uniref:Uncharacterized protein n=1 Tax=Brassica cretica TaxID=69181 RepID=A0A8S9IWZ6_BRACR|nr:hypothetical protein F2Q70_00001682 [Brassica cretica]
MSRLYKIGPWQGKGTVRTPVVGRCVASVQLKYDERMNDKNVALEFGNKGIKLNGIVRIDLRKGGCWSIRNVEAVGVNQIQVLPTQLGTVNTEAGLPQGPILPTEVQVENVGDQRDQDQGQQGETSHTEERVGLNPTCVAVDDETGPDVEVAEPSIKDVLEAMKLMGAQMVTLTQAFTPLVNSSVGQVTPPVCAAPQATGGRLRSVAEVVRPDPGRLGRGRCLTSLSP